MFALLLDEPQINQIPSLLNCNHPFIFFPIESQLFTQLCVKSTEYFNICCHPRKNRGHRTCLGDHTLRSSSLNSFFEINPTITWKNYEIYFKLPLTLKEILFLICCRVINLSLRFTNNTGNDRGCERTVYCWSGRRLGEVEVHYDITCPSASHHHLTHSHSRTTTASTFSRRGHRTVSMLFACRSSSSRGGCCCSLVLRWKKKNSLRQERVVEGKRAAQVNENLITRVWSEEEERKTLWWRRARYDVSRKNIV